MKPLAAIYPNTNDKTSFGVLTIKNSSVAGYQSASVSAGSIDGGGGAAALYYKKPDGSWTYLRSAQEPLLCSTYSTTDLKNAFKGELCFDPQGDDSIVK